MNGLVTISAKRINIEPEATTKSVVRRAKSQAKVRAGIELAKKWYIQGVIPADVYRAELRQPSLNDLANRSGLSLSTLQHRSREEGWVDQHEAFARQAMDSENHRLVRAMVDQHARARVSCFNRAMQVMNLIGRKMDKEENALTLNEIVLLSSALGKVQRIIDRVVIGPQVLLENTEFCNVNAHASWTNLPKPHLPSL